MPSALPFLMISSMNSSYVLGFEPFSAFVDVDVVLDLHFGDVGHGSAVRIGLEGNVVSGVNLAVGDLPALGELGLQIPDLLSGLAERITLPGALAFAACPRCSRPRA